MKLLSVFTFILILRNYIYCKNIYTLEEIFEIFNNINGNQIDLITIIDCLCSTFKDIYTYYEVAKNPPQPSFNPNYHKSINIEQELRKINTKDTNMYKFYQKIKLIFDSLGDQHFAIDINNFKLKDVYFVDPIKLKIEMHENKPRMFAEIKVDESDYQYFKNNDTVFNTITKNENIPIKAINGKDPFDFITYFGGDYEMLKSPHGCFRYKFFMHNKEFEFFDFPLSYENLTNFDVVYENGENFNTSYMVYSDKNLTIDDFKESFQSFFNKFKSNKVSNDKLNKNIVIDDLFVARTNKINRKLMKYSHLKNEKKINSVNDEKKWDYNFENSIGCRVDHSKKVNIFGISNFGVDNDNRYPETLKKCVKLIDENNYPIVLVNMLNQGGIITNAQYVLELLSPKTELNFYSVFRKTDIFKEDNYLIDILVRTISDIENCEPFSFSSFMNTETTINYGNSVSDKVLGPFLFNGKTLRIDINDFKESLKNPRKPTDILMFTDGFSYSATSLLLKFLQYYGGGITAGYFINPNLNNVPFDSSLSPSSVFPPDYVKQLEPKGYNTLNNKYNYQMSFSVTQTFYSPTDLSRPLEYEVTPVDEKVNIYINKDFDKYNILDYENYDIFIDESLKILEKYKTQCNPNNKKLLLITDECDGEFKKHTHGGYICGDDGFWTKKCVASYCDIGYIFDHNKKECVENACGYEDVQNKFIIAVILILVFVIAVVVTLIICIKIHNKRKLKRLQLYQANNNNLGVDDNLISENTLNN